MKIRLKKILKFSFSAGILFLCMFLLIGIQFSYAQTSGTNYLRIRVPQEAVTDSLALDTIPISRQAVSVTYSDGIGRSIQDIQVQGSPGLKDFIAPHVYDSMGRQATRYLPYSDQGTSGTTIGSYRAGAVQGVLSFYNPLSPGAPKLATDSLPFAQTVFDGSPLGRVIEQGGLGKGYQPGSGHTSRSSYQINSPSDRNVGYWIVSGTTVSALQNYQQGTLTQTIITDPNGHRYEQWKDFLGRVVSSVQMDAPTSNYITSYVYNDLNQLAYIVTPGAVRELVKRGSFSFNESGSDAIFTEHIYAYHYDSVGRVVEKKIPGKGWQYLVYNRQNQVVLSQDSNMRAKGQWSYIKYDALSRIIQTGIYTNTSLKSRRALQGACDQNAILWETWQSGTGYTNLAFPQQSTTAHGMVPLVVFTKSYYDDYTFSEASAKPFRVTALNGSYSARTQGLLTGESVYVLGTSSQFLTTVNYYDSENMLIQQQSDNHLGQVDTVSNQFNFIGELIKRRHNSAIGAASGITLQERYTYDQVGRQIDTWESYQNTQEVLVSHLEYNEVGKVVTKRLHSTNYTGSVSNGPQTITENTTLTAGKTDVAGLSVLLTPGFLFTATPGNTYVAGIASGTFLQNIEYRYTIRGQLRTINSPTLTTDGGITQSDSTSLFGEQLNYSETTGLAGTPQYGGNISSISWRNRIEVSGQPGVVGGSQGFTLGYDAVDRQTTSKYYQLSGNTWTASATDAFSENIPKYDEMGNIDSLVRKDKAGTAINNLSYQYQSSGNKLAGVTDKGTEAFTSLYSYDGNGNMVSDSKKGITVTYNYLDLPDTLKLGNSRLVYTYSAGGIKLYKQLITSGSVVSQRHYVGGVEATATSSFSVDGKIEYAAMPEGKLISTGGGTYQYEYFLQDHIGTTG